MPPSSTISPNKAALDQALKAVREAVSSRDYSAAGRLLSECATIADTILPALTETERARVLGTVLDTLKWARTVVKASRAVAAVELDQLKKGNVYRMPSPVRLGSCNVEG